MTAYIVLFGNRHNDAADWRVFTGRTAFVDAKRTAERLAAKWDYAHVRPIGPVEEYVK